MVEGLLHRKSRIDKGQRATPGVAILEKTKYRKCVKSWEPINEII